MNRTAPKLRHQFYQSKIATLEESSTRDWWKHTKPLLVTSSGSRNEMQGLANKYTDGDLDSLVNYMNGFFVSVCEDLPRLQSSHPIFDADEPLPAEFIISVTDTKMELEKVKVNKATGPENIPPWVFSHLLAAPVRAFFNSSLREGVLPKLWKSATVIPLSKKHPPDTVENDIRPISLIPNPTKVFESLVLKWVDICVKLKIDDRLFGGMPGTTTDVLIEMLHKWYEATDVTDNFVSVLFLDYRKAFDLINHDILINKLVKMELPAHLI